MSPSEAAAAGLGWVPENHPLYGTKGFAGYKGETPDDPPKTPDVPTTGDPSAPPPPPKPEAANPWMSNDPVAPDPDAPKRLGDPNAPMPTDVPPPDPSPRRLGIPGDPVVPHDVPPPTPDPFAASGGGQYFPTTKQWVPKNNPDAMKAAQAAEDAAKAKAGTGGGALPTVPGGPIATPALPGDGPMLPPGDPSVPPPTPPSSPQPAPGAPGTPPPTSPTTPTPGAPGAPGTPVPGTKTSTTPDAPPAPNTTDQGGQDVLRNALIAQMSQDPVPDANDPALKAQLDPYAAARTRQMRDEISQGAEESFAGGQDFGAPEKLAAAERAGQDTGLRASDLVGREITARRAQISDALTKFAGVLSEDQKNALTRELAQLDNAFKEKQLAQQGQLGNKALDIQKELGMSDQDLRKMLGVMGLKQTGELGNRELDIREELGKAGLSNELVNALLQNQEFRQMLGFNIGQTQAGLNKNALLSQMNG